MFIQVLDRKTCSLCFDTFSVFLYRYLKIKKKKKIKKKAYTKKKKKMGGTKTASTWPPLQVAYRSKSFKWN